MARSNALRRDIDGLRGVAVAAVVAYHAFPEFAPGGFAGVDVFFVISGFLITGLVVDARDRGTFTFAEFYARRARRLLPALAVVLGGVLLAAWALLSPLTVSAIARHAIASAAFVPNILSWLDAGYFDQGANQKPLLHLWSLGVEEQFYLLWPALLLWTPRRALPWTTGLIALGSFVLALVRVDARATEAFYLLHTRLWEPALGGALALAAELPRPARSVSGWLGLACVGAAFVLSSGSVPWPGAWTLLPTLGAALILAAGQDAWPNRVLLGSSPLVAVGLISYPLYLWHWPLLSFSAMIGDRPDVPETRARLVLAAVALAALTWAVVERPIRGRLSTRRRVVPGLVGATVGLAGLSALLMTGAIAPRQPARGLDEFRRAIVEDDKMSQKYAMNMCDFPGASELTLRLCHQIGDPKSPRLIVVWGDSHAVAWSPAWADFAVKRGVRLISIATSSCPPLVGVRNGDDPLRASAECLSLGYGETVLADIRKLHPERVVLVARWSLYANGWSHGGMLERDTNYLTEAPAGSATMASSREALSHALPETVRELSEFTKVTILRGWPQLDIGTKDPGHRGPLGYEPTLAEHRATESFPDALIDQIQREHPEVTVLDPAPSVCDPRCEAVHQGAWFYRDDNHITPSGAIYMEGVVTEGL